MTDEPEPSPQFKAYVAGLTDGATYLERKRCVAWLTERAAQLRSEAENEPGTDITPKYQVAIVAARALEQAALDFLAGKTP